jgi:hypothetical protein
MQFVHTMSDAYSSNGRLFSNAVTGSLTEQILLQYILFIPDENFVWPGPKKIRYKEVSGILIPAPTRNTLSSSTEFSDITREIHVFPL